MEWGITNTTLPPASSTHKPRSRAAAAAPASCENGSWQLSPLKPAGFPLLQALCQPEAGTKLLAQGCGAGKFEMKGKSS